jgi:fibro-slime domain-containing protein
VLLRLLLLSAAIATAADPYLALKARFYDHDYGDFGGEFSATTVTGCAHDVHALTRGMVRDTLPFDAAKGKKIPQRGTVDDCSAEVEKWFDPSASRSAACGTLFFRNVGDTLHPVWKFDAPAFFPVDSASPQRRFTVPGGGTLANDYAYCMEINAALDYAGGETLKVRGDDDTWIFVDGRLAADQGGIHFAQEEAIALDTLPFLKGKTGRTLDLDVYYCSRQPGTAVFGLEAAARLRPLALRSLSITDSAGRPLTSQDILIGRARVCARAAYQGPGEERCGNYQEPPDLSFLSADWDLNGTPLSLAGGQSCLDLDPASFPHDTRLSLTARSGGLVSRIALTLLRPAKPKSGLLAGDGRAERVEVVLDTAGGPAPDGLEASFDFAGARRTALLRPDPDRPGTLRGMLADADAGPLGVTGFAPVPAATRQTIFGKVANQSVSLRDGVAPLLAGAVFHWGPMNGRPAYLDLQASETLAGAGDSLAKGLAWKRPGGASLDPRGTEGVQASENRYFLALPAEAAHALKPGDSVSLSPAARDARDNAAGAHFVPIAFPRSLEVTGGALRVRNDPARGRFFVPRDGAGILIPVDSAGRPLAGGSEADRLAAAGGPILEIPVVAPLARIRLAFHDHLGEFVNVAEQAFDETEWAAMRAASPGDTIVARLLWHPVARTGNRIATGAYVVQGRAWTRDGLARGPDGEPVEVKAASFPIPPRLFGFLRD